MTSITEIARKYFEACETGKGWERCRAVIQTRMRRSPRKPNLSLTYEPCSSTQNG